MRNVLIMSFLLLVAGQCNLFGMEDSKALSVSSCPRICYNVRSNYGSNDIQFNMNKRRCMVDIGCPYRTTDMIDIDSGKCLYTFSKKVRAASFSADGEHILLGHWSCHPKGNDYCKVISLKQDDNDPTVLQKAKTHWRSTCPCNDIGFAGNSHNVIINSNNEFSLVCTDSGTKIYKNMLNIHASEDSNRVLVQKGLRNGSDVDVIEGNEHNGYSKIYGFSSSTFVGISPDGKIMLVQRSDHSNELIAIDTWKRFKTISFPISLHSVYRYEHPYTTRKIYVTPFSKDGNYLLLKCRKGHRKLVGVHDDTELAFDKSLMINFAAFGKYLRFKDSKDEGRLRDRMGLRQASYSNVKGPKVFIAIEALLKKNRENDAAGTDPLSSYSINMLAALDGAIVFDDKIKGRFSPCGKYIYKIPNPVSLYGATAEVIEVASGKVIMTIDEACKEAYFSPDDTMLVVPYGYRSSKYHVIRLYDNNK